MIFLSPGPASSPNDVLVEGAPKNLSFRRASGTGLTMNLRPAEWTTWAVVLGEIPRGGKKYYNPEHQQEDKHCPTNKRLLTWYHRNSQLRLLLVTNLKRDNMSISSFSNSGKTFHKVNELTNENSFNSFTLELLTIVTLQQFLQFM